MATVRHLGLFPLCVQELEAPPQPTPFTFYPIGLPLEAVTKWYWRVKVWRVQSSWADESNSILSTSIDLLVPSRSNYFANSPGAISAPIPEPPIKTEKELVCHQGQLFRIRWSTHPLGFINQFFDFDLFRPATGAVLKHDELYYPHLIVLNIFESTGENAATNGNVVVLDGFEIPMRGVDPSVTSSTTITPHEYWPYDPGDGGGPIYDSTTGAQLRPFPN